MISCEKMQKDMVRGLINAAAQPLPVTAMRNVAKACMHDIATGFIVLIVPNSMRKPGVESGFSEIMLDGDFISDYIPTANYAQHDMDVVGRTWAVTGVVGPQDGYDELQFGFAMFARCVYSVQVHESMWAYVMKTRIYSIYRPANEYQSNTLINIANRSFHPFAMTDAQIAVCRDQQNEAFRENLEECLRLMRAPDFTARQVRIKELEEESTTVEFHQSATGSESL